jgi:hypothetical protein
VGKRKISSGTLCAYCGNDVGMAGTQEDVIPRCLFPKTHRRNLVKVPTCRPCNDAKARRDGYMRDWLLSGIDPDEHVTTKDVYNAFLRAAGRRQSAVAQAVLQYGQLVPVFTESGLCAGCGYAYPLDGRRIRFLGERIAKGLYYHAHGYPLPASADIGDHLMVGYEARHQVEVMRQMGARVRVLGAGECVVMSVEAREGAKEATLAMVILYNVVALIVSTRDEPGTVPAAINL